MKIIIITLLIVAGLVCWITIPRVYRAMDESYQNAMDPIRIGDAKHIVDVILEYADATGSLPFEKQASEKPFMVLIGHSRQDEDMFAQEKVLSRDAVFANSNVLEAELSRGLGREIVLPRDPQRVATYAPNVYIYFVSKGQLTVISHLYSSSENSVKYEWRGGVFYSYTLTYGRANDD